MKIEPSAALRVEVTPAMIDAGARVLEDSGLMEHWPGNPARLVVRDMLLASLRLDNAFRDGAKAERERTRERDAAKDAVIEAARDYTYSRNSLGHLASRKLHVLDNALAALATIEADPT